MSNLELLNLLEGEKGFYKLKFKYEKLINDGANINSQDFKGETLLIKSVSLGLYKFTKLLLSNKKIGIDIKDNRGCTAIIKGIFNMEDKSYQIKICELLLKNGASLEMVNTSGYTPLGRASYLGYLEIVKLLLKFERVHNFKDHLTNTKSTPLIEASSSYKNNIEIIKLLLKSKNPGIYHKDEYGYCAFLYACRNGDINKMKLLLRKKNINSVNNYNNNALLLSLKSSNRMAVRFILGKEVDINRVDTSGFTALNLVCKLGYVEELLLLLKKGVDINYINSNGYTGFMFACKYGKLDIVKILLENNAKTNYLCKDGKSGFMLACENGYTYIVKFLLNVDISLKDNINKDNMTPLMLSCLKNQIDVVKLLINNDVELNIIDKNNSTALVYAFKNNNIGIIELLLENGADVNTISYECMEDCIKNRYEKIIELLLKNGYRNIIYNKLFLLCTKYNLYNVCKFIISNYNINLNYYEYDDMKLYLNDSFININCEHTPLIIACMKNYLDIVKLLLDNNVDVNFRVGSGNTVFTLYCKNISINSEIIKLLLSRTDISICDDYNRDVLINICDNKLNSIDKLELIKSLKCKLDIYNIDNFGNSALDYIIYKFFDRIDFNNNYFCNVSYEYYESYIKIIILLKKSQEELEDILLKVINKCSTRVLKEYAKKILDNYLSHNKALLIKSCKNNYKGLVKLLIESGYDLNYIEEYKSALDTVLEDNNIYLIEVILKGGGYISYEKLRKYKDLVADNNLDLLKVLKKHELFLNTERTNNLMKLLCMKKVDNTTFGGNILINDYDVKRYISSFM